EERRRVESLLARSRLDLNVRLGSVDLPASTIVGFEEGDTIVLGTRLGRPLEVLVGGRPRFRGLPGTVGGRLALRVTDVIEDEAPTVLPPSSVPLANAERPHIEFTR